MTVHWTRFIHANIEFSGIPLLIGLDKTAIGGTALIGDADIDAAGKVLCVRLAADAQGDPDVVLMPGHALFDVIAVSVAEGCADEIDKLIPDADGGWSPDYVAEHAVDAHEAGVA